MEALAIVQDILGIGEEHLAVGEMLLRLLITFPLAIVMVRVGDKRFLGELSALDLIVAIMLGSIVSRGITGNAPFLPTLATGLGLVLLHRFSARWAVDSDRLALWIKGKERKLVEDGTILWDNMRKSGIGEADLMSALRRKAHLERVEEVEAAYLERTGDISVIPKE